MGIIHGSGHEYAWASIFFPLLSSLPFSMKTRDKPATNPFDYSLDYFASELVAIVS